MTEIELKEQELKNLKTKENQEKWESYLNKLKIFLEKLKGKTLIGWTSNGQFYMFKIFGFKEKYYIDKNGFNGQWSPSRWFELETSSYLQFRVPDDSGRVYKFSPPSISENAYFGKDEVYVPYGFTKLVKIKGKNKNNIIFPKFIFNEDEMINCAGVETKNLVTLGKLAYDSNIPDYDKTLYDFISFTKILPNDGIFNKALEIHKEHTLKVLDFYESFKTNLFPKNSLQDSFNDIK